MSEYVLILLFISGPYYSAASTSIVFPTQAACDAAYRQIYAQLKPSVRDLQAICVPRNAP